MGRGRRAAVGHRERPGSGSTPGSLLAGDQPAPAPTAHPEVPFPAPALDSSRGCAAGHDVRPKVRAEIQAQRPQCDRAPVRERYPAARPPEVPLAARRQPVARRASGCADCAVARPQPVGGQPSPPTAGHTTGPVSFGRAEIHQVRNGGSQPRAIVLPLLAKRLNCGDCSRREGCP